MKRVLSVALTTFALASAMAALDPEAGSSEDTVKAPDAQASQAPAATEAQASVAPKTSILDSSSVSSCLSDPIVLDEIKKKREEIDQKWKELAGREAELKAREGAIDEELKKLQATRDEISKLEDAHLEANQEKIGKVVETLEAMNPKASSQMLASLDDGLAVTAMAKMDTVKLSKILNVMDPKRASKLTELLSGVVAGVARAKHVVTASNDVAETTIAEAQDSGAKSRAPADSAKKGEKPNDQQSESIISGGPDSVSKPISGSEKP